MTDTEANDPSKTVQPVLTVWVIYENPSDFPGKYVLRAQDVYPGIPEPVARVEYVVCDTIDEARAALPEYQTREEDGVVYGSELICFPNQPGDPPHVVESWL